MEVAQMAVTQLSDLYNPTPFNNGINQISTELNAFAASGVLVEDPRLSAAVAQGGLIGEMPFYNDLTHDDPNLTSDDPAVSATPAKIGSSKAQYRLAKLHKSWSTMDFASEVTSLNDPAGQIISRIGAYWAAVQQKRIIQSALGVLADNVANNSGDMLYTLAGSITEMAIENAAQTMGDHKSALATIVVHSAVETQMRALSAVKDIHDPQTGSLVYSTFNGRRLVVDDGMPKIDTGTNYVSILFAAGAFRYGNAPAQVPSELEREASSGNGGGQDIIHSRQNYIIQPTGMSCTGTPAAESLTPAELAVATTWDRTYDRKNVPFAFLKTTD